MDQKCFQATIYGSRGERNPLIQGTGICESKLQNVYAELSQINEELKKEAASLQSKTREIEFREERLKLREEKILKLEEKLDGVIKDETDEKIACIEKEYEERFLRLKMVNDDIKKDNKRLKDSLGQLSRENEGLRQRLSILENEHEKNLKKCASLEGRVSNFERLKSNTVINFSSDNKFKLNNGKANIVKKQKQSFRGKHIILHLLEWVTEYGKNIEECVKVLSDLTDLLDEFDDSKLICFKFLFSVLQCLHANHQRSQHTATLRRLGEHILGPRHLVIIYTDPEVRMLSSLIVLYTPLPVDQLAHGLESVRNQVKSDDGRSLFLKYNGTIAITQFLRPTNKALQNKCLDIHIHMCSESMLTEDFLNSLSNDLWFRTISLTFKEGYLETECRIAEKISVLLQKLSKDKKNRKYFEAFGFSKVAETLLKSCQNQGFLVLNLRSIINNLSLK